MLLRKLQSPRAAVRTGMTLVVVGLLLNTTSLLLMRSVHATHLFSAGDLDFLRGIAVGLGIALEIGGIVVMVPAARAKQRSHDDSTPPRD